MGRGPNAALYQASPIVGSGWHRDHRRGSSDRFGPTRPVTSRPRGAGRRRWRRDHSHGSLPFALTQGFHPQRQPTGQVTVAKIKSQIKRNRQNEKRRLRNKSVRSEMHTRAKSALAAAASGEEHAEEKLRAAIKRIDKAAAKGVIHKNTAARRKSRLIARIRRQSPIDA